MANPTKPELEHQSRFPALVIYNDELTAYETLDYFVLCRTLDIRAGQRGRFARSRLLDYDGLLWHLDGATVAHGVGLFGGWRLLSRHVRARPTVVVGPQPADLDSVKQDLVRLLTKRDSLGIVVRSFCATIRKGEARRLIPLVESAATATEIIDTLIGANFPERQSVFGDQAGTERS